MGFRGLIAWTVRDWHGYKRFFGPYTSYFFLGLAPINVFHIGRNAIDIWWLSVRE